jgi:hypothetical protein
VGQRQAGSGPGDANAGRHALVSSVSCSSAGNCAAGGSHKDASFHNQGFVASQHNGTWVGPSKSQAGGTERSRERTGCLVVKQLGQRVRRRRKVPRPLRTHAVVRGHQGLTHRRKYAASKLAVVTWNSSRTVVSHVASAEVVGVARNVSPSSRPRFAEMLVSMRAPIDFRPAPGVTKDIGRERPANLNCAAGCNHGDGLIRSAHRTGPPAHHDIDSKPRDHTRVIGDPALSSYRRQSCVVALSGRPPASAGTVKPNDPMPCRSCQIRAQIASGKRICAGQDDCMTGLENR